MSHAIRIATPAYSTVVARLARARGPATGYPCVCNARGARWTYIPGRDPSEVTDRPTGIVYSYDLDQWVSRCSRCARLERGVHYGADNPRWLGDRVSWRGMHSRLIATSGTADAYVCHECLLHGVKRQAAEWALIHTAPNQIVDEATGYPLVLDPAWYRPLCHSHARQSDRGLIP